MVLNAKRKVESKDGKPADSGEPDGNLGNALRSAYLETIREDIPQEMLDLLGKLK